MWLPRTVPSGDKEGKQGKLEGTQLLSGPGTPSLSNSLKKGQEPLAISPAYPQKGCRYERNLEHRQDSRKEEAATGVAEVRKFPEISPKEELLVY